MEKNNYQFQRLTPIDNIELGIYEDAIDYVFDNPDIKNVAVSGAYSAGKSSVLASYKKRHANLRFLHISLAHFRPQNQEEEADIKESVLEGKILNQLIHQIPSNKIPQTNFRIKRKIDSGSVWRRALMAALVSLAILYFFCFDLWKSYVLGLSDGLVKTVLSLSVNSYALIIDGILLFGLFCFFIYGLIKVQKNKALFRKFSLQGNEIEIFEESDDSYFDKYLNEVLYLFENADADVVVFEDMDRFHTNKIFERLREINMLANIRLQKEEKKVLRFFYLLRDDIFDSKDRIKFFDYIVPVVPVVDGSNSYNQMKALFQESGLLEKFDEGFLQGLSLYIDDMRLLKNIYNEFVIYYNRLDITELDCNKMLAMVTYKNLFPHDFAKLQLNQGFVYTLFSKKSVFAAEEIRKLNQKVFEISTEMETIKSEHLISVEELDAVYEKKRGFWNGQIKDEDKEQYEKRKQAIEDRENGRYSALEEEKAGLEQEIVRMQGRQLHEIVTRENIDFIFSVSDVNEIGEENSFSETKGSEYFDLLKYLIRNGYINETYADYMTYFYENSLSRTDKMFLRSIADKRAKEYTYQLKDPQLVVSKLRQEDFSQAEILNFNLLTYLLRTIAHERLLGEFLRQLRRTRNFPFVSAYFDITEEPSAYVKHLNLQWPELFATAVGEHALTEKQLRSYSLYSIYVSDDETLKAVNQNGILCNYVSSTQDYLAMEHPDVDRLLHVFRLLGVSFIGFAERGLHKGLLRAVYEESFYEINSANLDFMQREILGVQDREDIFHRNYTFLLKHPDSTIAWYVEQNMTQYIDAVLEMSEGMVLDTEEAAVAVLNHPDIVTEQKERYIRALQTDITAIREVSDSSLWQLLLDCGRVLCSEQNIMDYFIEWKSSDDSMGSFVKFINRSDALLDFSKAELDGQIKKDLFVWISQCPDIENVKYEQMMQSFRLYYTSFNAVGIREDKLAILIDTDSISMNDGNLAFMRKEYSGQLFRFIQRNIEEYVNVMQNKNYPFAEEELLQILSWDSEIISDELKIKLLEPRKGKSKISILDKRKEYSPALCAYILNNNLMESDLGTLFMSFAGWDAIVQDAILGLAVKNMKEIINNPKMVSRKLRGRLLQLEDEVLSKDAKDRLLTAIELES